MFLHGTRRKTWEKFKGGPWFGRHCLQTEGVIHGSPVDLFRRVAPGFKDTEDELVLLCIDDDKLASKVKWEESESTGRFCPHVHGPLNRERHFLVLPYLKDSRGDWIKNTELQHMLSR